MRVAHKPKFYTAELRATAAHTTGQRGIIAATPGKLCRFFIEEPELYDARSR